MTKTVILKNTDSVYDGFQVIGEYDTDGLHIKRRFIYAAGIDEPIAMVVEPQHQGWYGLDEFHSIAYSWLCESGDSCYKSEYDFNANDAIDANDLTQFIADYYLDDRPLLGNSQYYGYVFDGTGNVVAMTFKNDPNETGNPNELPYFVETYKYDPFGAVTIYDPNGVSLTDSAIGNPYMFTGRRYDSESGLYYYRFRMYNPNLGRFVQAGPIGYYDSMNLYQYCGNNPINYIDPWGLYTQEEKDRFVKPVLTEQDLADAADMYYRQRLSQSREQDGWLNADSPYRYIKQKYSYNGKKYDDSSVNYIAIGMKAARDGRTLGQMYLFMIGWKLCKPDPHLPCWGDYYFANWGYDYYYDNYSDGNAPVTPSMPHIPYVPY